MLNKIKKKDFQYIIKLCEETLNFSYDFEEIFSYINEYKKKNITENNKLRQLEYRWYKSLKINKPDFDVYNDPYYILDLWLCWILYSRQSVKILDIKNKYNNQSIKEYFGNIKNIIDLGCGVGLTTIGLKQIFNDCNVYGTNVKSFQKEIAEIFSKKYNFKIISNSEKIENVDLVFASEYFEHFEKCIDELSRILKLYNPKYLVIANGFSGRAIGHFNYYTVNDNTIINKKIGKIFNDYLRKNNYIKLKTKIFNQRPSIWSKKEEYNINNLF